MQLKLLRNATLRLSYAGHELLIDPMLGEKHTLPSWGGREANPTGNLPEAARDVLSGVELVLVSHLHPDHFDETARDLLREDLPLLVQPGDEATFEGAGFQQVQPLQDSFEWQGLSFTRTLGAHGSGPILQRMGSVMGFVLKAEGEPTLYWLGDTILNQDVLDTVEQHQPDVIVSHSGGAVLGGNLIIMDDQQTVELAQHAPHATVVAVHMESLDHCMVSRAQLRQAGVEAGLRAGQLQVPADGEVLVFKTLQPAERA